MKRRKFCFIIVKYHDPKVEYTINDSVFGSYSAKQCNITQRCYKTEADAEPDLTKLREFNESVYYGVAKIALNPYFDNSYAF